MVWCRKSEDDTDADTKKLREGLSSEFVVERERQRN